MKRKKVKRLHKICKAKLPRHRLLQQVIPSENVGGGQTAVETEGSSTIIQRPGFSLPLMTANFRRFNARWVLLLSGQQCPDC